MTHRMIAVVVICAVGLLSGCAGVRPGVAAQVGDETITVSEVNEVTDGYCRSFEPQLRGEGQVLPNSVIADFVVQNLAMAAVVRQMAEEYDVEPTAAYRAALTNVEQQAAVLPEEAAAARITIDPIASYIANVLESIGRQELAAEGVAEPTSEDALARGRDLLSVWLAENRTDIEIDPQYQIELVDRQPEHVETGTSVAVSDTATTGGLTHLFGSEELSPEDQERLTAFARDLPASQSCG